MSNLLYHCALSDTVETHDKEPKEVLLRFYGPSHGDTDIQLEIFNKLASENLGPSLYSLFDEGRPEEYLPSSPLSQANLTEEDISAVIARKIAAIHKLNNQPLNCNAIWLIGKYNQFCEFLEVLRKNPPEFSSGILESTRTIAIGLIEIDLKKRQTIWKAYSIISGHHLFSLTTTWIRITYYCCTMKTMVRVQMIELF